VADRSRYRPGEEPDYSHRFHAGNVGDVWKHCVLAEVLARIAARTERVTYVESHAGAGAYALGPTGEWTEGVGKLWSARDLPEGAAARYVALCRRLGTGGAHPTAYPGSPRFARAILGGRASLRLWERDADTLAALAADVAGDQRVEVVRGEGLAALTDALVAGERTSDAVVTLVDPPWTQKADWIAVPDAVAEAAARARRATIILWYPVKSLTRPNAMMLRLRAAGVSATLAELITTPLEHQRHRLNGSGALLIRPPAGAIEALAAAAAVIGPLCATRPGVWSSRMVAW
jgi:23S rRNA (adenine2030-N6)-methyltransferase